MIILNNILMRKIIILSIPYAFLVFSQLTGIYLAIVNACDTVFNAYRIPANISGGDLDNTMCI